MPVEWTEARIYKLILSYLRHECLWKHDSDSYNDLEARYDAYLSIIRDVNNGDVTVNEVRDKLKQIRRIYRTELAKINEANFRGIPYKPKITWFELIHEFLCAYIAGEKDSKIEKAIDGEIGKRDRCNIPRTLSGSHRRYSLNERPSRVGYFPIQPNLDNRATKLADNGVVSRAKTNLGSQNFILHQPMSNVEIRNPDCGEMSLVKKHKSQRKSGDEFDVFGKNVACQLRELSLPHALRTQTKIQSLLAEERINSNREKDEELNKTKESRRRSNRSSRSGRSNFYSPSASDLSSCGTASNGRRSKRSDLNHVENCHSNNFESKQQRYNNKHCVET